MTQFDKPEISNVQADVSIVNVFNHVFYEIDSNI